MMLSTKETVSGLRKVTSIMDDLVKRFPQYTHQRIAEVLVDEYGKTLVQLRKDIDAAKAAGKNPFQKAGSLSRLSKYEAIIYEVTGMLERLGQPQAVDKEWNAIRESFKEAA